ncbi:MAG TPA: ABC transporter permease [Phototrophicaceae bacterium]|jgi:peptide/nickel transport system permease protein|nr:ABC transporter permease [Phototrophicaceae bacterium]
MGAYVIRRLLQAIPLLAIIGVLSFLLIRVQGNPMEELRNDPRVSAKEFNRISALRGYNDPLANQFVYWLIGDDWLQRDIDGDGEGDVYGETRGVLRGDFGDSERMHQPATQVVASKLPNTLQLGLTAYVVTIVFALAIGIFTAIRQYSLLDNVVTGCSFILFSMPIFVIALLVVYLFAVQLQLLHSPIYFPVQGMVSIRGPGAGSLADRLWHMVLPVFCLAAISIAGYSRYIRASMLDVLNADYVRTARSKGLAERRVTFLHALKNASLPLVTLIGLDLPFVLGGALVTEQIFGWDGIGLLFIKSLGELDTNVLILITMMIAVAVVFFQLVTDLVYALLDPRVRFA